MPFKIVTDTSANLPESYVNENDLTVVPFTYIFDNKEHACLFCDKFDADRYYNDIRTGLVVSTSQVPPQRYIDYITPLLEEGNDVLYIGMSSGISGAFGSSLVARQQLLEAFPDRKIICIDTKAASLGEGLAVLRACSYREKGLTIVETAELVSGSVKNICQLFTVDDLMHLRRGGRISTAAAVVGSVLQIKPILKGDENGKIVSVEKIRGRRRSILALADYCRRYIVDPAEQTIGLAHTGCRDEAMALADVLRSSVGPKDILFVDYEPVTGAHVGPGAIAMFFQGDDMVRYI